MTFINTIYKLPHSIKNTILYTDIEKNQHKMTKNIWSMKFNEIFVTEKILLKKQ